MFETLRGIGEAISNKESRFYTSIGGILRSRLSTDHGETILIRFNDYGDYVGTDHFKEDDDEHANENKDIFVYQLSNRGNVLYSPFLRSAVTNSPQNADGSSPEEKVKQQIETKLSKIKKDILDREAKWFYTPPRDRVLKEFESKMDKIIEDVLAYVDISSKKKEKYNLAVKFGDYGSEEADEIYEKMFDLYVWDVGGFEKSYDGVCAVCGKKGKVSGKVNPYTFYTVDAGNFAPEATDKNASAIYPVCHECASYMFKGQMFAEKNLTIPLGRGRLMVVLPRHFAPKTLDSRLAFSNSKRKRLSSDRIRLMDMSIDTLSKIARNKSVYSKANSNVFETVINRLSKVGGNMCYTFLFFNKGDQPNSINVMGMAVDVPPSRLEKLYEAVEGVRSIDRLGFFSITKTYFDFFDYMVAPPNKKEKVRNPLAVDMLVSALMGKFKTPKYDAVRYVRNMMSASDKASDILWYARDSLTVRKFFKAMEKRFS